MTDNPAGKRTGRIAEVAPLINAADGLTLGQICSLTELEPSTIQNWIKRGFVPHPVRKKYHRRHLARILLIAQLRESMQIDRVGELLCFVNGDADDESDDLIPEEDLYDIFHHIALELERRKPAPDDVEELVNSIAREELLGFEGKDKILNALNIMAYTHIANLYKRKADSLFQQNCQG